MNALKSALSTLNWTAKFCRVKTRDVNFLEQCSSQFCCIEMDPNPHHHCQAAHTQSNESKEEKSLSWRKNVAINFESRLLSSRGKNPQNNRSCSLNFGLQRGRKCSIIYVEIFHTISMHITPIKWAKILNFWPKKKKEIQWTFSSSFSLLRTRTAHCGRVATVDLTPTPTMHNSFPVLTTLGMQLKMGGNHTC